MSGTFQPSMDEVMTPNPTSIDINAPVDLARKMMIKMGVLHLPVTEDGVVEAVINQRDIRTFSAPGQAQKPDQDILIKDICSSKIHTADVNDELGEILKIMINEHIEAIILLRDGEMAGIFTKSDACRILAKHLGFDV